MDRLTGVSRRRRAATGTAPSLRPEGSQAD